MANTYHTYHTHKEVAMPPGPVWLWVLATIGIVVLLLLALGVIHA